jgi:hypothetical protein
MAQLPSQSQFGDYGEWPGRDVLDSGGERLGDVREIYLDRETGTPEWVLVDVEGGEARFVPLADAAVESSSIRVAHPATVIRSAPGIGPEPRIDQSEERRLYAHYGLGYSERESGSGLPEGTQPTGWGTPAPEPTEEHAPEPTSAPTAWGTQEPIAQPDPEAPTSWSAAGATNDAPPPAEPPSATELERAGIPEPPAAPERAVDVDEPEPFAPATAGPQAAATDTPEPVPEAIEGPAPAPALPDTPAKAEPLATFITPEEPPPAARPEPAWTSSPQLPEKSGGIPRPAAIGAAAFVAVLLFVIIRRLR